LERAYALSQSKLPDAEVEQLLQTIASSMDKFTNPADWQRQPLTTNSPLLASYRVGGGAGFNIIHRNIDGTTPFDFWRLEESAIASVFFSDLFPSADLFTGQ